MAPPAFAKTPSSPDGSLADFLKYIFHLGSLGFGGPIVLSAHMRRDLVEERGWITGEDFEQGLALAQLAPGPLAAQLAIYLGWVKARVIGATLVGIAFILPSFLMVLGLSALYVHFGGLFWMQGAFYGIGAAVIAVMGQGAYRLIRRTVGNDFLYWGLAGISGVMTAVTEAEIFSVFLLAGVVAMLWKTPPKGWGNRPMLAGIPLWWFTGLLGPATSNLLLTLLLYFAKAGAFIFGSGLAIVPFLHSGVVMKYHWLNDRQFLDAVAVAMITPGPVVITVAFIGYLVAGVMGAILAALGVFLPCYLFVILPAPYYRRFAHVPQLKTFIGGVTSAAVGAIAGAAFVLGRRAIIDLPTISIFLGASAILFIWKKVPEPPVILGAGLLGFWLKSSS